MRVYFHDIFVFPLPEGHRFPAEKYRLLRQRLLSQNILRPDELFLAEAVSDEQLALVHTQEYLKKVKSGLLSEKEIRRLGLPWSPELVERSRRSVGSTIAACRSAMQDGLAVTLGGGTHHAYADHGEGFCVFNDVAVAARTLQAEGLARRVVILDLDVHQGNGTAAIFRGDPSVFTFSIHGEKNFPHHKEASDLDIGLPDGCDDARYLEVLEGVLPQVLSLAEADLAIYLAGADPFLGDRLGRLALTKDGLARRDHLVISTCRHAGLPLAITLAGGYGRDLNDTVEIHLQTIRLARDHHAPREADLSH